MNNNTIHELTIALLASATFSSITMEESNQMHFAGNTESGKCAFGITAYEEADIFFDERAPVEECHSSNLDLLDEVWDC